MKSRNTEESLQCLNEFENEVIRFENEEFSNELDLNGREEEVKEKQNEARFSAAPVFRIVSERFEFAVDQKRRAFKSAALVSNVDILKDVRRLLDEEIQRATDSHDELRSQTGTLQKIGFSADRIAAAGSQGVELTSDVRRIEARDKMIVWTLFALFVLSSVWIVGKRVGRVFSWLSGLFGRVFGIFRK